MGFPSEDKNDYNVLELILDRCVCRITSSMTGNDWLTYSYVTFEIYSKTAVDGIPVQFGDVVGLKYPYSSNSAWLTHYSNRFYPRSCSSNSKTSCAAENTHTGFKIFKKLSWRNKLLGPEGSKSLTKHSSINCRVVDSNAPSLTEYKVQLSKEKVYPPLPPGGGETPIWKGRGCLSYILGVKTSSGYQNSFSLQRSTAGAFQVPFSLKIWQVIMCCFISIPVLES